MATLAARAVQARLCEKLSDAGRRPLAHAPAAMLALLGREVAELEAHREHEAKHPRSPKRPGWEARHDRRGRCRRQSVCGTPGALAKCKLSRPGTWMALRPTCLPVPCRVRPAVPRWLRKCGALRQPRRLPTHCSRRCRTPACAPLAPLRQARQVATLREHRRLCASDRIRLLRMAEAAARLTPPMVPGIQRKEPPGVFGGIWPASKTWELPWERQ